MTHLVVDFYAFLPFLKDYVSHRTAAQCLPARCSPKSCSVHHNEYGRHPKGAPSTVHVNSDYLGESEFHVLLIQACVHRALVLVPVLS